MDNCPYCHHELKEMKDYPLIKVAGFEVVKLPEIIGKFGLMPTRLYEKDCPKFDLRTAFGGYWEKLPEAVLKLFQASPEKTIISHEGKVYQKEKEDNNLISYIGGEDITEVVNQGKEHPNVRIILSELEKSVGQVISCSNLLNIPSRVGDLKIGNYKDLTLVLSDRKPEADKNTVSSLMLKGGAYKYSGGAPLGDCDMTAPPRKPVTLYDLCCTLAKLTWKGELDEISLRLKRDKL